MAQDTTLGSPAPDFTLQADGGKTITLSEFKGNPVIVYFYPKDNTPGCTTQAIAFTEQAQAFASLSVPVIGISPDSPRKHDNFIAKHELNIILGSDPEHETIEAFGSWVEKKMYGKTYMGVDRSTFLIDSEGKIAQLWRKVRVKGHIDEVLRATKELVGA